MGELRCMRILQRHVIIADKGYCSYKNYVMAISMFKVMPIIFPRKNFSLKKLMRMFSYPLEIFFHKSRKKLMFVKLVREFTALIKEGLKLLEALFVQTG